MEIPENNGKTKPPGFIPKRSIPENTRGKIQKDYRKLALKKRLTPHQQHVMHQQHMANVKNNPGKYGKK